MTGSKRYLAVIHNWFMDSKGFDLVELKATDREQAELEGCYFAKTRNSDFNRTAYLVLEIQENEVLTSRKLTWRERITGRVCE
jgi:hypothetical protein